MMVFLLILLAHVLADFIFQPDTTAMQKAKGKFTGFLSHTFFVLITTVIVLLFYEGIDPYILAAAVAGVHFLIDYSSCART